MVAASVPKPTYSANVHSWMEILLSGTPRPAQSRASAEAVPAAPKLRHAARAATTTPPTMRQRLLDALMIPPSARCGSVANRCTRAPAAHPPSRTASDRSALTPWQGISPPDRSRRRRHACPVEQPDVAGHGPALRPDLPVEDQVRVAAAARRRRRRWTAAGSAVLVAAAALLAGRADDDPARSPAAPAATRSPGTVPPAWSPPNRVVDVAVGSDRVYALLGSCAGPEPARACGYRLMVRTRGDRWTRVAVPLPPPSGTGFAARLLLTGSDTLTVLDEPRRQAYVGEAGAPFAIHPIRDGPALAAGMPAGLVPELVGGRVTVLD